MNKPAIDFYFDFISPYSYLAATQIARFEKDHGIVFNWLPVNLPRLIKLSGNTPPGQIRNKALYSLRDLKRWATYLDVPFKMIMPGSFDSRPALRIAGALQHEQRAIFCSCVFRSIWSGAVDPTHENWLKQSIETHQLPIAWLELQNEDFEPNTHAALKAGAFGVPTFVLHPPKDRSELFFGLDHMDFLARACQKLKKL
ncbi:MAG: 2-hydroxychromene-2-carboxylate isomerase [Zetaproteobacteria bacterium CG_4_9_14_3_um_filter_53_7]|nr:MAG: 2-hydroxychromene-2-carboxylate isomerase [Zetaproteobacteria bacterium CG_4_9_14_3_um_filter_53_7]